MERYLYAPPPELAIVICQRNKLKLRDNLRDPSSNASRDSDASSTIDASPPSLPCHGGCEQINNYQLKVRIIDFGIIID